jgi:tocopherol cyclase
MVSSILTFPIPDIDSSLPHAGYHWDGCRRPFFEGWYYRVTLPNTSFAFMYSIGDPQGDQPGSGGTVQLLGPQDQHLWRTFPKIKGFWANSDRLALGHWGQVQALGTYLSPQYLDPDLFFKTVTSGYQATANLNQGLFRDPVTQATTRWVYEIEPVYTYGIPPEATMGVWSYLPVFEPGWQILMAHGWATGWLEWQGERYSFHQVPAYAEKNWGGSFPKQWFWINSNRFRRTSGSSSVSDLSVTATGALRRVLWWQEAAAMVSLHWQGQFWKWIPENSEIEWQVTPWGSWRVEAHHGHWLIQLSGKTEHEGNYVMTPGSQGMEVNCRDTLRGELSLKLWRIENYLRILEVEAHTEQAGLEVGGLFASAWNESLRGRKSISPLISS